MGAKRNTERDLQIWSERKAGATLQATADGHGVTRERVRQIVAKEDQRIKRQAYFDELRKQKEGASNDG
jgi:DNA-directed RNA polymerase sigma subunit (sigma70/sigma32)